jgi:hypothetical protein
MPTYRQHQFQRWAFHKTSIITHISYYVERKNENMNFIPHFFHIDSEVIQTVTPSLTALMQHIRVLLCSESRK